MAQVGIDRILVVAATARELAPSAGWLTLIAGVGPVEAAARTAAAIERHHPLMILHVGIAGARRTAALPPPTLIIGSESIYCDLGVPDEWAPNRLTPPPQLVTAAKRALPNALVRAIGTAGRVGQTTGCAVEAMEGFAVLRAAALGRLPAIEVRAIANEIEEQDRGRWHFEEAFAAVAAATPALISELSQCAS